MRRTSLGVVGIALAIALPSSAEAATRYVSLSGTDNPSCLDPGAPCRHVQYAADQASGGDVVEIGPGVYSESVIVIDRALTFVGAGSGTLASDAGATVIRPPAAPADTLGKSAFELRRGGVLRSLRAEGGQGGNSTTADPAGRGGAGVAYFGTEPGQSSLLLEGVVAVGGPGGSSPSPGLGGLGINAGTTVGTIDLRVVNSEVTMGAGTGGQAVILSGSSVSAEIVSTRIGDGEDNLTGVVVGGGAKGSLDSALVDADEGAYVSNGSLTIKRSRLHTDKAALEVTPLNGPSEAEVTDSLLTSDNSSAAFLHSFAADPATLTVEGSTLIGRASGGALFASRQYPGGTARVEATLRNSIVRELPQAGPATDLSAYGGAIIEADYSSFSTVAGTFTGVVSEVGSANNVAADPLFVDPAAGNFALQPASPLIDRGDPAIVAPGQLDLAGSPRSLDGNGDCAATPDIGAFESADACLVDAKPTISKFRMTNRVFAPAGKSKPGKRRGAAASARRRRAKRGTTFKYRLSEPARVAIAIERRKARRKGSRKARRRWARVTTLRAQEDSGGQSTRFSGRAKRKPLKPGRYRATIVATDSAGQKSAPRRITFRIIAG